MADFLNGKKGKYNQYFSYGVLFLLVFGVIVLSSLAFISPISEGNCPTATPLPENLAMNAEGVSEDAICTTPNAPNEIEPPTPEEIGYTDGIIFWSTVLILILLIGTLREIIRRKDE